MYKIDKVKCPYCMGEMVPIEFVKRIDTDINDYIISEVSKRQCMSCSYTTSYSPETLRLYRMRCEEKYDLIISFLERYDGMISRKILNKEFDWNDFANILDGMYKMGLIRAHYIEILGETKEFISLDNRKQYNNVTFALCGNYISDDTIKTCYPCNDNPMTESDIKCLRGKVESFIKDELSKRTLNRR